MVEERFDKISISVPSEIVQDVDDVVARFPRKYYSRSHFFSVAADRLLDELEETS